VDHDDDDRCCFGLLEGVLKERKEELAAVGSIWAQQGREGREERLFLVTMSLTKSLECFFMNKQTNERGTLHDWGGLTPW
jgi:hypothetical protein